MIRDLISINIDYIKKLRDSDFILDLWTEYFSNKDSKHYISKTFISDDLNNLLNSIALKITNNAGNSVYKIQAKYGSGKSHTLATIYHYFSINFQPNICTLACHTLNANTDTLWAVLAKQLNVNYDTFSSLVSPGRDAIHSLLLAKKPVLIIIDELLEYVVRASDIKLVDGTLASQTLTFMHSLCEAVSLTPNCALIVSLPVDDLEQYSHPKGRFYLDSLSKILGRSVVNIKPYSYDDIPQLVNKKLIDNINKDLLIEKAVVLKQNFLNTKTFTSINDLDDFYNKFIECYPFHPAIYDYLLPILLKNEQFQSVRSLLKLLSSALLRAYNKNRCFVTIGDIDVSDMYHDSSNITIYNDFIDLYGDKPNSLLDIKNIKNIEKNIFDLDFNIYKYFANIIYLLSINNDYVPLNILKQQIPTFSFIPVIVDSIVEKLKDICFYIHSHKNTYAFLEEPNDNKIYYDIFNSIKSTDLETYFIEYLNSRCSNRKMNVYIATSELVDIPDDQSFKLVIFTKPNKDLREKIIRYRNDYYRVNINTLFFLEPDVKLLINIYDIIKHIITIEKLMEISDDNKKISDLKIKLIRYQEALNTAMLKCFKHVISSNGSTYDLDKNSQKDEYINDIVYKALLDKKIVTKLSPLVISTLYFKNSSTLNIESIYALSLSYANSMLFETKNVLYECIINGVKEGVFAVGLANNDKIYDVKYCQDITVDYITHKEAVIIDKKILSNVAVEEKKEKIKFSKLINITGKYGDVNRLLAILNRYKDNISSFSITVELKDLTEIDIKDLNEMLP